MTQVGNKLSVTTGPGGKLGPAVTFLASLKYLVVWRSPSPWGGYETCGRLVEEHIGVNMATFKISDASFVFHIVKPAVGHVSVDYSAVSNLALVAWSDASILGGRIPPHLPAT